MKEYPVIGIGGRLSAGKDFVADYLVENYGYVKQGMSDALLEYALILNPLVRVEIDSDPYQDGDIARAVDLVAGIGYTEAKRVSVDFRTFLQKLGTEVGRDINPNLWASIARDRARKASVESPVIVTGIRFKEEIDMIRDLNGVLVYVVRPVDETEDTTLVHSSETSVSSLDFDTVLRNYGTPEDLYAQVDVLANVLEAGIRVHTLRADSIYSPGLSVL